MICYNCGNPAEVSYWAGHWMTKLYGMSRKKVIGNHTKTDISNGQTTPVVVLPRDIQLIMWKENTMPRYTVRIDGREDTVKVDREEGYDVGDSIVLTDEERRIIYDMNGEEMFGTIPLPVIVTVVAIE